MECTPQNADIALAWPQGRQFLLQKCSDPILRTYYRIFVGVAEAINPSDIDNLRLHLQRQYAFGSQRFRSSIEAQLGRRAGPAKIGRPRKKEDPSPKSAL